MPISSNKGRQNIVFTPHKDQIEWIAVFIPVCVGRATDKFFKRTAKFFFIFNVNNIFSIVEGFKINQLMVSFEIRIFNNERKAFNNTTGDEIDIDCFEAFVKIDKDKARYC